MRNLIGTKFGKLTVISKLEERVRRSVVWLCQCDCGNTIGVPSGRLISGNTKSCGCLKMSTYPRGFSDLFQRYKQTAKRRSLEFSLTKDQFFTLTTQDCVYCGAKPENVHIYRDKKDRNGGPKIEYGRFIYSGIDRIDNSKGYIPGNCAPCCIQCNKAKNAHTLEDFTAWIERVYHHLHKGDTNV